MWEEEEKEGEEEEGGQVTERKGEGGGEKVKERKRKSQRIDWTDVRGKGWGDAWMGRDWGVGEGRGGDREEGLGRVQHREKRSWGTGSR